MVLARMSAGYEGIEPLDLVRKAMFDQKIQSPVGNGWLCSQTVASQNLKDVIRPHGFVFVQQNLKYTTALCRQLEALRMTGRFCGCHRVRNASVMIVLSPRMIGHRLRS